MRENKVTNRATYISWQKDETKHVEKLNGMGIYFLQTNLHMIDEVLVWNIWLTYIFVGSNTDYKYVEFPQKLFLIPSQQL